MKHGNFFSTTKDNQTDCLLASNQTDCLLSNESINLPGRTSINEQLLSIHNIVVRHNSSVLAVDTVEL